MKKTLIIPFLLLLFCTSTRATVIKSDTLFYHTPSRIVMAVKQTIEEISAIDSSLHFDLSKFTQPQLRQLYSGATVRLIDLSVPRTCFLNILRYPSSTILRNQGRDYHLELDSTGNKTLKEKPFDYYQNDDSGVGKTMTWLIIITALLAIISTWLSELTARVRYWLKVLTYFLCSSAIIILGYFYWIAPVVISISALITVITICLVVFKLKINNPAFWWFMALEILLVILLNWLKLPMETTPYNLILLFFITTGALVVGIITRLLFYGVSLAILRFAGGNY